MMSDGFAIEGECKECGPTTFSLPDHATDDAWIICDGCGQLMVTWGAYKASASRFAVAKAKKNFGGSD